MKTTIQSIAIVLIALLSINTSIAQKKANPHFNKTSPPSVTGSYVMTSDGNTIFQLNADGTVYGVGDASSIVAYMEVEGSAKTECYNGGEDKGPIPGQTDFHLTSGTEIFNATNGHADFDLSVNLAGTCKGGGNRWTSVVSDVNITRITLYVNGTPVDLTDFYVQQ